MRLRQQPRVPSQSQIDRYVCVTHRPPLLVAHKSAVHRNSVPRECRTSNVVTARITEPHSALAVNSTAASGRDPTLANRATACGLSISSRPEGWKRRCADAHIADPLPVSNQRNTYAKPPVGTLPARPNAGRRFTFIRTRKSRAGRSRPPGGRRGSPDVRARGERDSIQ
jgi:hypothetical protein